VGEWVTDWVGGWAGGWEAERLTEWYEMRTEGYMRKVGRIRWRHERVNAVNI